MDVKEVKVRVPTSKSKNFYLIVFSAIKEGLNPAQICRKYDISKQSLNWYIKALKHDKLIKKVGYGTWEIVPENEVKRSKSEARIATGEVRGHGFQFTIILPKNLKNWENRRAILQENNILFTKLDKFYGGAEKLEFLGKKVILNNKSIIVYEKDSFFGQLASEVRQQAIDNLREFINKLANLLKINFEGRIQLKVSRQHYALIKNALAEQYNSENKDLKVYGEDDGKLWLIIDNSFKLQELETLHSKTATDDNKIVQDFFNDLKKHNPPNNSELAWNLGEIHKALALQVINNKEISENIKKIIEILIKDKLP